MICFDRQDVTAYLWHMFKSIRPALPRSARIVLLLCLMVQPVLASWGFLHALAHQSTTPGMQDHGAHGDAQPVFADSSHHDGGLLHGLMHHAECCMHSTVLVDARQGQVMEIRLPTFVSLPIHLRLPSVAPGNPFRPPIAA